VRHRARPGAIWLSKGNHTYRVGVLCETFAVHFPTTDRYGLAELFGTDTGDDVDKFTRCAWIAWSRRRAAARRLPDPVRRPPGPRS
jgi:hypothetical protein